MFDTTDVVSYATDMTKTAVLGTFLFLLALISQRVDFTTAHAVGTVVPASQPTTAALATAPSSPLEEDEPGWNCATMGNHVCGPTNDENLPAGCYDDGVLVAAAGPCQGQAPTQEQESDAAYAAAQHAPKPMTGAQIDAALKDIPADHECVLQTADATVYGLVADTDPQCDRWWGTDGLHAPKVAPFAPKVAASVLAEDGSRVAPSFGDHVTTTGATQARCDYLGKQRVSDSTYGHRCV